MAKYSCVCVASGTRTQDGESEDTDMFSMYGLDSFTRALFFLDVTAASGTLPVLKVYVQMLMPDGSSWADIAAFSQMVATGQRFVTVALPAIAEVGVTDGAIALSSTTSVPLGPRYKFKWKVSGSLNPSFTFAVWMDIYD